MISIISFIVLLSTLCDCVFQPPPLKSVTLTPQDHSAPGVTLTIPSPTEVTTTPSAWDIQASPTSSDQFHLVVELDSTWGWYPDKPSIMTVDFEGYSAYRADIVIGFESDHSAASIKLFMDNLEQNLIYPHCDTDGNWDKNFVSKYLDTEILQQKATSGYQRSCGLFVGDSNVCPNDKDQKGVEMVNIAGTTQSNSFPLQFIITNYPGDDYSIFEFVTSHQMCGFKKIPMEAGYKIYFAVDYPGEICSINAIHITYFYNLTYNPTTDPTSDPTHDPTLAPTRDPSESPTTAEPSKTPSKNPTLCPTTALPTANPTTATTDPTVNPTDDPTTDPTIDPTINPTGNPTVNPSSTPTENPSGGPTIPPTKTPTKQKDGNVEGDNAENTDSPQQTQDDAEESTKSKEGGNLFIYLLSAIIVGGVLCLVLFGALNMYLRYKENKKIAIRIGKHSKANTSKRESGSHSLHLTHVNVTTPVINSWKHIVDIEQVNSMSAASPTIPKPPMLECGDGAVFGETVDTFQVVNHVVMDDIINDVDQGTAGYIDADNDDNFNHETAGYIDIDNDDARSSDVNQGTGGYIDTDNDDASSDRDDCTEGDDGELAMGYDDDDDDDVKGAVTMGGVQTPFNEEDTETPPPPPPPPVVDFVN